MKHRKLLPAENSTYTTQPADCGFCGPVCLPPTCIPTVVIAIPPLPSFPSPPPPPHDHHVSPYVIIFVCLAVGFFLFIMYNVIVGKVREVNQGNTPRAEEEELVDENRVHHHPIWLISTVGLQPSVIDSISVCKYKKGDGLIEGTECSVCLNEFQQDETLRILPKCSHAFHISCIDTWLKSHTNCPLCRAYVVPSSATAPLPLIDQNSASSTVNVNSQIENSEPDRQLSENRERNGQARENRDGTEERDLQPLRRSVSFDSSSLAETMTPGLDDFPDESEDDGENSHSEIVKNQDGEKPSTSR